MSTSLVEPSLALDAVGHALLSVIRQPAVTEEFHLECTVRSLSLYHHSWEGSHLILCQASEVLWTSSR